MVISSVTVHYVPMHAKTLCYVETNLFLKREPHTKTPRKDGRDFARESFVTMVKFVGSVT